MNNAVNDWVQLVGEVTVTPTCTVPQDVLVRDAVMDFTCSVQVTRFDEVTQVRVLSAGGPSVQVQQGLICTFFPSATHTPLPSAHSPSHQGWFLDVPEEDSATPLVLQLHQPSACPLSS